MKYAVFHLLKKRKVWIISFIAGLSIGIIYANVKWFNCTGEINNYISYWSGRVSKTNIDKTDFQKYIFEYRLKELLMIFIFNLTVAGRLFNCGYLGYCGYSSALMESILTLKYGYKGIGLYAASIMPHYIVYALVLVLALSRFEMVNNIFFNERKKFSGNRISISQIKIMICNILCIIFLAWVESIMESYINIHIFV